MGGWARLHCAYLSDESVSLKNPLTLEIPIRFYSFFRLLKLHVNQLRYCKKLLNSHCEQEN